MIWTNSEEFEQENQCDKENINFNTHQIDFRNVKSKVKQYIRPYEVKRIKIGKTNFYYNYFRFILIIWRSQRVT